MSLIDRKTIKNNVERESSMTYPIADMAALTRSTTARMLAVLVDNMGPAELVSRRPQTGEAGDGKQTSSSLGWDVPGTACTGSWGFPWD